jgi:hypothetical protein
MENQRCKKCSKNILKSDKYAITLFFVKGLPSDPFYEHLKCPEKVSIVG